jgi:hypothetical protein
MPIDPIDLLTALGKLTPDQIASVGLVRAADIRERDHPLKPLASAPDRAKQAHDSDRAVGSAGERWFQRQVGDVVAELHETTYPGGQMVVAVHRYRRTHTPVAPRYLLDGYDHADTVLMSDLAGASEPEIWARLADHASRPTQ